MTQLKDHRQADVSVGYLATEANISDLIDLSREELDFRTSAHVREAAKKALDEGATHYTTRPGLDPLRVAVSEKLLRENSIAVDPKGEVLITCGTQEALFVALHVLLSAGDEVIIPTPANPAYAALARQAHATPRYLPGDPTHGFALDVTGLRRSVTSRTRAVILASPSTPAGSVLDLTALETVRALAVEHNLVVVSDESHEAFVYERATHRSIASLPGMAERTVTVNGFSVPYAMYAWRVGYVAGPVSLLGSIMSLKQALSICSPAVSQYAALAALTGPQDALQEARKTMTNRREQVCAALRRAGIRHIQPAAGPFVLLSGEQTGLVGAALAREVERSTGVRLAAGNSFGTVTRSWLRLSLREETDRLLEAVHRLESLLGSGGSA